MSIEEFTITEVLEHWFNTAPDKTVMFGTILEEVMKLYFINNHHVQECIKEIESLEKDYQHYCDVTTAVKEFVKSFPMPTEILELMIEIVKEHVEND